ncbi:kinesin, putative [Talaromyces stipitatus ATCC 10500]|uniref:Kinesin, putative n=1 Tax=Talaromyces stipitatus (strain ATCC 10500 / CBS 375.48 / QM 6759 / NRRL 1006) TaxID=441959 RepID=B8M5B0_TALSN|nr:kinesin, putative [Talaromyces stipitatus ATCC 10500]EED19716.1 kinesin, putative [Talaromyces stipitatus ATCC 10500]
MTNRDSPSSRNGKKSANARVSLQHQDYRPFETLEPDVVFTGTVPTRWAIMYVDRSGNVREMSNLYTSVFDSRARDAFAFAQGLLPNRQDSLPSPHTAYRPGHRRQSSCARQSKRQRAEFSEEPLSVEVVEAFENPENQVLLEIGDTKKVTAFYTTAFTRLQQINCRLLAKNFIKIIEPRKQVRHPYNGGRKSGGAPGEKGDPEDTKPDWWPRNIIHKEPDHLKKNYRVKLLVHLVQNLFPIGITVDLLEEAVGDTRRHLVPEEKAEEKAAMLEEIIRVRKSEERYLSNKIDGTTQVYVTDYDRDRRGEPESDDEGETSKVIPPPASAGSSPQIQHLEASQGPLDVASMPQYVSPLETTSSFQMPAELGFTIPGQRTQEFVSTQSEFGHLNFANTLITGPLPTPTHNQFMDHSQFAEISPTNHLLAVSPAHAQANPSASFPVWSSASQQNIYSPVDYSNKAGRQMPPHMVYSSYRPYSSLQDVPQTISVPEFSRPPDYDMANMNSLSFRTGSLSQPHIVHHRNSGDYVRTMVRGLAGQSALCDHADSHKNKAWQNYAAATAASCAKCILAYWQGGSQQRRPETSSLPKPASTVPFERDTMFVGREEIILSIIDAVQERNWQTSKRVALVGLGGVGKSQIAIEYTYRVRDSAPNTWIFWVHASNTTRFEQGYREVAAVAKSPGRDDPKCDVLELVKKWLSDETNGNWLMILDNADDVDLFFNTLGDNMPLVDYLPYVSHGSILLNYNDAHDLRRDRSIRHPVITTWQISFDQIRRTCPKATDLLALMSMFDRQGIPEELISEGTDRLQFEDAIAPLISFSLIQVEVGRRLFELHRLVQVSVRQWPKKQSQFHRLAGQSLRALEAVFPSGDYATSASCQILLPHVKETIYFSNWLDEESYLIMSSAANRCGHYLYLAGRYEEADFMERRALAGKEKVVNNLGSVLESQGKYEEAEAMHRQALAGKEKVLGADHPETLTSVNSLGSVLQSQGKLEEAEDMHRRAIVGFEKALGVDHPGTLASVSHLGLVLGRQGKYEEAEAVHRRALASREKVLDNHDHAGERMDRLRRIVSTADKGHGELGMYGSRWIREVAVCGKYLLRASPPVIFSILEAMRSIHCGVQSPAEESSMVTSRVKGFHSPELSQ